jgi:DNA repair exonuclease SbcCD ATPase subunit
MIKFLQEIKSLTAEIATLAEDVGAITQQMQELPVLEARLLSIEAEEKRLAHLSSEINKKQRSLEPLNRQIAVSRVRKQIFETALSDLRDWHEHLKRCTAYPPELQEWPSKLGPDELQSIRRDIGTILDLISQAERQLDKTIRRTEQAMAGGRRSELEEAARRLRREIEETQEGAGAVAKQAATIRERLAALGSTQMLGKQRRARLQRLRARRSELLDELERIPRAQIRFAPEHSRPAF